VGDLNPKATLAKALTKVLFVKRQGDYRRIRRTATAIVHKKQWDQTEKRLTSTLKPLFAAQINAAAKNLSELTGKSWDGYKRSQADSAADLARAIFDPTEWWEPLVTAALPVLARAMSEAAKSQMLLMGQEWDREQQRSTATEWLESSGEEIEFPDGFGIATDLPEAVKKRIAAALRESFQQDYWQKINETTRDDIEQFLRVGMQEGESIATMARKIRDAFPTAYNGKRATLVARTESAHALNSSRKIAYEEFKQEMGEAGNYIQASWLSVLGNTTRDEHANLDGVIANAEGLWNLDGYWIPWPGHISLPVGQRANCRCTISTEFGAAPGDGMPFTEEEG
jgi:hypothetical protein